MSWNLNVAVLRGVDAGAFRTSGPARSFDEAESSSGLHVADTGDGVVLLDPLMEAKDAAARLSAQSVVVMLGGTADVYAIEAAGAVSRLRVLMAGEVVEDVGEPLPEESALAGHEFPEDAHIAVLERLLGRSFGEFLALEFRAVEEV